MGVLVILLSVHCLVFVYVYVCVFIMYHVVFQTEPQGPWRETGSVIHEHAGPQQGARVS